MRIERDSMGEMEVPDDASWGASTQRAVDNFPISADRVGSRFIHALGMIKARGGPANAALGVIDPGDTPTPSSRRRRGGGRRDERPVGGQFVTRRLPDAVRAPRSNMNANEVIANRAAEILGEPRAASGPPQRPRQRRPVLQRRHPDRHPRGGRRRRCVEDTASRPWSGSAAALEAKAVEFDDIVKSGRTHLMDATPVRLGQEFGGYAAQVRKAASQRLEAALPDLRGTRPRAAPRWAPASTPRPGSPPAAIARIAERTGFPFREADNHFEAQAAKDAAVFSRRGAEDGRGVACSRSPTTSAGSARVRAPGSARSASRPPQPGLVDHARQGEPGDGRGGDAGRRPGDRQRRRHHLGGRQRQLRTQRDDAADRHNLLESVELMAGRPTPSARSASTASRPTPSGPPIWWAQTSSSSPPWPR